MRPRNSLIALIALVGLVAAPAAAQAYDCDRLVVDDAGAYGSDVGRVETAARNLQSAGADVRVRTVRDFAGLADLEALADGLQAACPTWRAQDGGFKRNLLVFMVSYGDRRGAALFYGETWESKLGRGVAESMIGSVVVPELRAGRDVQAFETWSAAVGHAIAVRPPAESAAPTRAPAPSAPAAPSKPADLTVLWILLGGLLAIGGAVAVFLLLRSRKRREAERQKARREAQARKNACVQMMTSSDDAVVLAKSKLSTAAESYAEEDVAPLQSKLEQAGRLRTQATVAYGKLDTGDNDPDRDTFATETYVQIGAAYAAAERDFDASARLLGEVEQGIERLSRTASAAPKAVAESGKAIEAAVAAIEVVTKDGFRTEAAAAHLNAARASLKEAQSALEGKRFVAASGFAEAVLASAKEAAASAGSLPARRNKIVADLRSLSARVALLDKDGGALDQGAETVKRLEAAYADACWESIKGNGKEAEAEIDAAHGAMKTAEEAATMDRQEWDVAERELADGNRACERAESLMRSVAALEAHLRAAAQDAPIEIRAAETDIASARAYIKEFDPDIDDGLEDDLDAAAKNVEEAKAKLAAQLPDVNYVIKLAKRANAVADEALASARGQHEAAERLRQKAASALRDAQSAYSKAKEYLEDHQEEVSASVARTLADAAEQLTEARAATDPSRAIALAEKSAGNANAAFRNAKSAVDEARRLREEQARRDREAAERRARENAQRSAPSVIPFPGVPSIPSVASAPSRPSSRGGGSVPIGPSRRGGGSVAW